jgi:hypothetical protein
MKDEGGRMKDEEEPRHDGIFFHASSSGLPLSAFILHPSRIPPSSFRLC